MTLPEMIKIVNDRLPKETHDLSQKAQERGVTSHMLEALLKEDE